jgi:hypothetical protein
MHLDRYPVYRVKDSMMFEFTSEGRFGKIEKMIVYSPIGNSGFFNLGFGDKNVYTGELDGLIITNNGDSKKVLATVASTLYTFTDLYPNALVLALGATYARTRLYRMEIANNFELIKNDFKILGFKNGYWQPFQKNVEFDQFLAQRQFVEKNIYNLVLMENKQNNYKGAIILGIKEELEQYRNHPYFLKKAKEAEEFLRRVGVPEEFKDKYPLPPINSEKK